MAGLRASALSQRVNTTPTTGARKKSTWKNMETQYRRALNVRIRTISLTLSALLGPSCSSDETATSSAEGVNDQWNRAMNMLRSSIGVTYVRYVRKKPNSSSLSSSDVNCATQRSIVAAKSTGSDCNAPFPPRIPPENETEDSDVAGSSAAEDEALEEYTEVEAEPPRERVMPERVLFDEPTNSEPTCPQIAKRGSEFGTSVSSASTASCMPFSPSISRRRKNSA